MDRKLVVPVPWYVPVSLANFGLITTLIPLPVVLALMKARATLLQRHQETLLNQLYFAFAVTSLVTLIGGVQFVRKALSIRKNGFDYSYAAKAPRTIRCLAWLMAISFSGMIVFYCVMMGSSLVWWITAYLLYLLASMLGLAATVDFAAQSALASSAGAEKDIG